MPPTIDKTTIGKNEQAVTSPKRVEEPVSFKRYYGRAKRKIALPKRDIICPITTRVKSRLKSFVFTSIGYPPLN